VYWPVETTQAKFGQSCMEPTAALEAFLGPDGSADGVWQRVKTNL
jgi:hypothetical protein